MKRSKQGGRTLKRKVTLSDDAQDNYDEGLLTNEEISIMKVNESSNQAIKIRVKSDSLIDQYTFQKRKNDQKNNTQSSRNQYNYSSSVSRQNHISIDENDDEEEDILKKLGDEDVKILLEDVIKKRDSLSAQKKNQDYFCQILAQMILKNVRINNIFSQNYQIEILFQKINKENAFEIPLPDVKNMSDFAKVSEASWQKLSSSLDSGSKIYGYRVDSLHQESFKMLGGLIRQEYQFGNKESEQNRYDDESQDLINKEREKIFKKNRRYNEETIEKNIQNITLNKLDIQFQVDPLFCKTSAQFDDGSSKGILLNNIRVIPLIQIQLIII